MDSFSQEIKNKISFIFDEFILLPTFLSIENRLRYTFVAKTRTNETFYRLKGTLHSIKSDIDVVDVKNTKQGHSFVIGDKKVVIIYAGEGDDINFLHDSSSYGINSILGKILKGSNLKLTQDGLFYEQKLSVENHHSNVGEVLVTNNMKDIMDILELDYDRFKAGFNTQDDLFEFIATTPFLRTSIFTNPKKEHDLDLYEQFQTFLIKKGIESPGKILTFQEIDEYFPEINFLKEIEMLRLKEKLKKEIVTKFNGRIILNHFPDFDKNKIGASMAYFKFSFQNIDDYQDFLINNSIEVVMDEFKEIVKF